VVKDVKVKLWHVLDDVACRSCGVKMEYANDPSMSDGVSIVTCRVCERAYTFRQPSVDALEIAFGQVKGLFLGDKP